MTTRTYSEGIEPLSQANREALVKFVAARWANKPILRSFVEAQFGPNKVFELNWTGQTVHNAVASLIDDCIANKQLSKLVSVIGGFYMPNDFRPIVNSLLADGTVV